MTELSKDHIIKFYTVVSFRGSQYNQHLKVFTVPEQGVIGFSWNLFCQSGGCSHLMFNSNVVRATYSSGDTIRTTPKVMVVQVNTGDLVYVRTHHTNGHYNLFSNPDCMSSFSGWKVF